MEFGLERHCVVRTSCQKRTHSGLGHKRQNNLKVWHGWGRFYAFEHTGAEERTDLLCAKGS